MMCHMKSEVKIGSCLIAICDRNGVNIIGSVSFPTPARGWGAGVVEEARSVGLNSKDEGVCGNEMRETQTSTRMI